MFDHVKFGVSDFAASKTFYLKALEPLGVVVVGEGVPTYGIELSSDGKVSLCLFQSGEKPALLHLAFVAGNRQQVRDFHRAALEAGGKDNGAPGLRPQYHANYYAAFVTGPDGHNIEAVCHEPEARESMNPVLSRIGQIAITVSDVEKALVFYRDILGLKFLFSAGPNLAFLQAGDVRIMLSTPQGSGAIGANSILYFHVVNIEATHQSLLSMGATSERLPQSAAKMPDHELWLGFLRDPDGNLVGLMEEKRP